MSVTTYHRDPEVFKFKTDPGHKQECVEIELAKQGDMDACNAIVCRYQLYLIQLAHRFSGRFMASSCAADILSCANQGLMEAIRSFKPQRKARFYTWVFVWVRRRVLEWIEKEMRYSGRRVQGGTEQEAPFTHKVERSFLASRGDIQGISPDVIIEGIDVNLHIEQCWKILARPHRRLLTQRYLWGWTYDQIAERQRPQVSRSVIANRIEAALQELRRLLEHRV